MSDSEEHHFESKADAGASKTYPQQAGTIRKNGYIVIKNRPCKVRFTIPHSVACVLRHAVDLMACSVVWGENKCFPVGKPFLITIAISQL